MPTQKLRTTNHRAALTVGAVFASAIGAASIGVASQQDTAPSTASAPAPTPAPSASMVSPVQEARDLVEVLEARLNIKKAELRECEVHLEQAKRRLAAIEHMQTLDYQRAVERVRWAQGMYKKGYYSEGQLRLEQQRAEQLNPNPNAARGPAPPANANSTPAAKS